MRAFLIPVFVVFLPVLTLNSVKTPRGQKRLGWRQLFFEDMRHNKQPLSRKEAIVGLPESSMSILNSEARRQ